MTILSWLMLAISILEGVVNRTENKLDDLAAAAIRSALAELNKVKDSEVTKSQLESLRVERIW